MSSYNIPDIIFTDCLIASASGIYTYNTTFLLKLRPSASVAAAHIFLQVMGPDTTMNKPSQNPISESGSLAVLKLCDDGSNLADYQPQIQKAMGVKGLWRHIEGTAAAPIPYVVTGGKAMLSDGKMPALDKQLEAKESKITEFKKHEYLAQHIILSTTSARLGAKIKDMSTAEEMWNTVQDDATSKSTLFILDVEEQLTSMKLGDNDDPKSHLTELKQHFQLMIQQ